MAACLAVASSSPWTPISSGLGSASWNAHARLDLISAPVLYCSPSTSKPRLTLSMAPRTPISTPIRFDPFADDDEPPRMRSSASSGIAVVQENIPPQATLTRGRKPAPLALSPPQLQPAGPRARPRAPSFSAGSGVRYSYTSSGASLPRRTTTAPALTPAPLVPGAPSPFLARHYPTSEARTALLARTLLHRIHAVGRPRSPYASSCNGYESECGGRAYVPSRLSECVVA
ncbi:hypothetical protein MKEN_00004800 [Mycena kentingensis (nom. inval.)]|nr:hypothetical protein MKEN_00004800 [Mycena kentingensis (nom. inval.)]